MMLKDTSSSLSTSLKEPAQAREDILDALGNVIQIAKRKFSNEEMNSLWDVSAESLEQRGEICYMNPCL